MSDRIEIPEVTPDLEPGSFDIETDAEPDFDAPEVHEDSLPDEEFDDEGVAQ